MFIEKIKMQNYRKFTNLSINLNAGINIFVGDNDSGKSSVLEAIDLVVNGSIWKLENLGLNNIINIDVINNFLSLPEEEKIFNNLPIMFVELYLNIEDSFIQLDYEGKNNSENRNCCGIRLVCKPNNEYINEIMETVKGSNYFPYEYYMCVFDTFANSQYSNRKNRLKSMCINTIGLSSNYTINELVKRLYLSFTEDDLKLRKDFVNSINKDKVDYNDGILRDLNKKLPQDEEYIFSLKTHTSLDCSQQLTLINKKDNISLYNHGKGEQIITNVRFTIDKSENNMVLIEESENHLNIQI